MCIAFAPIFVRLADVGPTAAAFWRVTLSLPLLALLALPRAAAAAADVARIRWLLLAGLFFAADLAVWHRSILYTSVANSTLLANLTPVFVTIAAIWLFKEKVNRGFVAGLIVAMTGSAVLVADSLTVSPQTVLGDVLGIVAALFYSGYLLGVSRARRHVATVQVMWWTTLACALALLPLTLLSGEPFWPQSPRGWLMLGGLALVSHVGGQGLIAWALAHLPASFSSVSLLVQPVAAALLAWVLLAEPFGVWQALGGAIVLGGIVACRLATLQGR